MSSLVKSLERINIRAVSPDRNITGESQTQSNVSFSFVDADQYYSYDHEALEEQVEFVLRALSAGREQAIYEVYRQHGRSAIPRRAGHWNASMRRYNEAIEELACYGQYEDQMIEVTMTAFGGDYEVWFSEDVFNELSADRFLAALSIAHRYAWDDFRKQCGEIRQIMRPI